MVACVGCMVNTAIRGAALRPADDGSVLQHGRASGDACRGGVARPSDQARSGTIFDAASPVLRASRRAQAASATLPVLRVELLGPPRRIGQRSVASVLWPSVRSRPTTSQTQGWRMVATGRQGDARPEASKRRPNRGCRLQVRERTSGGGEIRTPEGFRPWRFSRPLPSTGLGHPSRRAPHLLHATAPELKGACAPARRPPPRARA